MNLDELRKKSSSSAAPLEEVSPAPGVPSFPPVEAGTGLVTQEEASSNGEAWGVHQTVTPSGIEIYYQAGPKRLYRIRDINIADSQRTPLTDWIDVPSVSEILDILNKPGLPWWGMKVGVEGVRELVQSGALDHDWDLMVPTEEVVDLLTKNKLTVNHVRDKAGDRGSAVHDALELWADEDIMPNPDVFSPDDKGYVEGLKQFIIDSAFDPMMCEVMVASLKSRVAGRFDMGGIIPANAEIVVKSYPKRKSVRSREMGGDWMIDLKTSKGVYEAHHLQLAGYNLCLEESHGFLYPRQGVLHVFADGRYELIECKANEDDWYNVRNLYDTMKRLK